MLRAHALSRGGQACGSVCACRAPHIRYLGRSVESSTKCRQERPPPRRHAFPGCKKRGGQYQQGALPLVPDTTWEASEGEVDETHSRASPLAGWLRSAPSAAGSVLSQPQAPSAIRPTLSGLRFTSRPCRRFVNELTRNVHIETFELDDASQGALKTSDISVVLTRRKVVSKDFCEALGGYAPLVLR